MCYVLVVDDNEDIRSLFKTILKEHKVETAANIKEASESIECARPDIIFLDLGLGTENGQEFLRSRSWESAMVVITGKTLTEDDEVDLMEDGAAAVMRKPLKQRKLVVIVKRLMGLMEVDETLHTYSNKLIEATKTLKRLRGAISVEQPSVAL